MTENKKTIDLTRKNPYIAFMMDGSTDVSGDEQETIYLKSATRGIITERFLNIGTPNSTKSQDLFDHIMKVFKANKIDTKKVVAMASDGASNMIGVCTSGLATFMHERVNEEIVNVHCLCHRLELAFRDVMKKVKLYDKLMTLLIGLYYFYKQSYKNKQGLNMSIEDMGKGVFPAKVTGTRWLPHLFRGINALLNTYSALEAHLATASHGNVKGEGLLKLKMDKHLMAFILFLQDALEPAMRLSLKLLKPEITQSESLCWVESTIELITEKKDNGYIRYLRTCEALNQLLVTGKYDGVVLKGATPTMQFAVELLQGFCDAIRDRFQTQSRNVLNATKVLNFGTWPMSETETSELKDFGNEAVKTVYQHFKKSLAEVVPNISEDGIVSEWNFLKKACDKEVC